MGEQALDLRLVVRAEAPSVRGTLTTSRGGIRTDRIVVAFPVNPGFWAPYARQIRLVQPDSEGRYEIGGLPAGRYYVAVVEEIDRSELFFDARLRSLADTADSILVSEDAVATLDLTLSADRP